MATRPGRWWTIVGFCAALVACGGSGGATSAVTGSSAAATTTIGVPHTITTDRATTLPATTLPTTTAPPTVPPALTLSGLPGRLAITSATCGVARAPNTMPQFHAVVCTMNPDGSDAHQVSPAGEDASADAWSYDGKSLIYTDAHGTEILDLATGQSRLHHAGDSSGKWVSPDGVWKLYWDPAISVGRADSSDRTVIIDDPYGPQGGDMSWAPDSKHFVYLSANDGKGGELPCNEVWIGSIDGSPPVEITHSATGPASAAACPISAYWSPDGTKILTQNFGLPSGSVDNLYVMNPDGTGLTAITHANPNPNPPGQTAAGGATVGAWSPDGKEVALLMSDGTDYGLYIMRSDGTALTKIDNAPAGMVHDVVAIAWAPG